MAPRRLLLVGEGNFSFAAALSKTLDPSIRITATCLQCPAELAGDPVAQENLQCLRERGSKAISKAPPSRRRRPSEKGGAWGCSGGGLGLFQSRDLDGESAPSVVARVDSARFRLGRGFPTLHTTPCPRFVPGADVRFGVDCTRLADAFETHDREFDRIYFNFPHCGRKAGIAENRKLLAKFFQSSADVLAEEGEVHVALCRGQGGTPADKPTREWSNSWQVVGMAALGGFILSDVHPFICESVPGYKCTGYRSQNKTFNLEGALNHVFTRSLPFEGSQPRIFRIKLGDQWFSFPEPEALIGKLGRDFLEAPSSHPVKTINEKLIAELGKVFPVKRLKCSFPLLPLGGSALTSWNCDCLSEVFWINLSEDTSNSESQNVGTAQDTKDFLVSFSELSLCGIPERDFKGKAHEGLPAQARVCLRPSLLTHLQAVIQAPDFLPGSLHILSGPVFRKCSILPFTMPAFHETLFILGLNEDPKNGCFQSLLCHLKNILSDLLTQTDLEGSKPCNSLEFVSQANEEDVMINVKSENIGTDCAKDLNIGSVIKSAANSIHKNQCFVFVSINLDLLAMFVWGISDWRILWTFDSRFLKNFVPGKIEPFQSYSLYPPTYVHDISFWLDEKKEFDELEFHTLARAVSQDTVISIQFLSRFQHPETDRVSLCYRMTYQTCDKALTKQQVISMQSQFRKMIEQQLNVVPR